MNKYQTINIILFLALTFSYLGATNNDTTYYALKTQTTTVGIGGLRVKDPYLSPMPYSGSMLKVEQSSRRFVNPANDKLSFSQKSNIDLGVLKNSAKNNTMFAIDVDYAAGLNTHFRPNNNLMFLIGGDIDFDLRTNYMARNVNNPVSINLSSNFNLSAEAQYQIFVRNQKLRFQYGVQTPLIGVMFVPNQNISYYEIFTYNNFQNSFHLSSFHNKQGVSEYLHIDYPVRWSTLRLAFQHRSLKYCANEMVFTHNNLTASVGVVMYLHRFKTKEKFPDLFINAYE